MKAQIIFYSAHGHIYKMAKAIEQGVGDVEGAEVSLYRVPELGPDDSGAAKAGFEHVPIAQAERLVEADAIFFGTPTRYGNMCAPMRGFIDATASLWFSGALIAKVASVFVSTASQHGGQETTITSFHSALFHLGMIVVGVPYSEKRLLTVDEVSGGTPTALPRSLAWMAPGSPLKTSWPLHTFRVSTWQGSPRSSVVDDRGARDGSA